MKNTTKKIFVAIFASVFIATAFLTGPAYAEDTPDSTGGKGGTTSGSSTSTSSSTASSGCTSRFFTFPAWYRGLLTGDCQLESPNNINGGLSTYIWTIVLNAIEIALQVIGYIAAGMIIFGGFKYLTNGGEPSAIVAARKTIINAAIGLGVSTASIGIVNLIFRIING